MSNYRIIHETGRVDVVRARTRATAIKLFMCAEGCTRAYFDKHYIVRVKRDR
jgi:hypothetical protein